MTPFSQTQRTRTKAAGDDAGVSSFARLAKRRRAALMFGSAVCALVCVATVWTDGTPVVAAAQPGSAVAAPLLQVGVTAPMSSLFPYVSPAASVHGVIRQEFASLLQLGSTFSPTPYLVAKWWYTSGGTRLYMQLSPHAVWSNGRPVTAQDVAAAVDFLASPTYNDVLQGTQGYRVLPIVGSRTEMSGHAASVSGFHAVSNSEFYFQLKEPDASALVNDFAGIMPLPNFALKSMPMSAWATSSFATMPTVVSGPFIPVQGNAGIVVFDANTKFIFGRPLLSSIIFKSVGATAVPGLFAAHELDITDQLSPVAAEQLSRQAGVSVSALPGDTYEALVWDDSAPDIGIASFRQAMMYAIHRTRLIKAVLGGYGVLANGPVTPASAWYDGSLSGAYAFAPETARTLLQAANFGFGNSPWLQLPDGRTFAPLIRYVQGDVNAGVAAHIIVKDLRDIAIEAAAQPLTLRAFVTDETLHRNPFAAYLMEWTTSPDPSPADLWTPKAAYNLETFDWADPKNPAVVQSDALIVQQAAATSPTARQSLLDQWQTLVSQHVPMDFLYTPDVIGATSARVTGVEWSPLGYPIDSWKWAIVTAPSASASSGGSAGTGGAAGA